MKIKLQLFILTLLGSASLNAAVFTVDSAPGSAAQYTQIDPAIAAASPGDTIYVSGNTVGYADATISKSLTLIGPGTFADKQSQHAAIISAFRLVNNTDHIKIAGFNMNSIFGPSANNVTFLDISNNCFTSFGGNFNPLFICLGLTNCSNWTIHNNIFKYSQGLGNQITSAGGCFNFIIENNIFHAGSYFLVGFNFTNAVIQHNTICYSSSSPCFNTVSNAIIQNNIFYNCDPGASTTGCTFNNNITYTTGSPYTPLGGNNIDNTDPQFANVTAGASSFDINFNYSVPAASPAHNAGSDGTDLGYYGGPPVINVSRRGEVINVPVVRQMNIQNITLPQNGNINVKVRSTISRVN